MGITQKSKSPRMIEERKGKPWRVSELLAKFSLNEKGLTSVSAHDWNKGRELDRRLPHGMNYKGTGSFLSEEVDRN